MEYFYLSTPKAVEKLEKAVVEGGLKGMISKYGLKKGKSPWGLTIYFTKKECGDKIALIPGELSDADAKKLFAAVPAYKLSN